MTASFLGRAGRRPPWWLLLCLGGLAACRHQAPEPPTPPPGEIAAAQSSAAHAPARLRERQPSPLSQEEADLAWIAWGYFENNSHPDGLVNATHGYPSIKTWDIATYLGALLAAHELGILGRPEFDSRVAKLLHTLRNLEFFNDELPNTYYHAETGEKVNYANQPGEVGFSAMGLGRLLIWLKIYKESHPRFADDIDRFVLRWDFSNLIGPGGDLFGASKKDGEIKYSREGHLGREEYAAKGFRLWGFNTENASNRAPSDIVSIHDLDIPYDTREPLQFVSYPYMMTGSYLLDKIELGWDAPEDRDSGEREYTDPGSADIARHLYAVQAARYYREGTVTARDWHSVDAQPYLIYDTVFAEGFAWNTLTPQGRHAPRFAALAVKTALGMWAIWDMPYSDLLFQAASPIYEADKGFYEGVYENGTGRIQVFSANTNGLVLAALLYKTRGKLFRPASPPREGLWKKTVQDCPPPARQRAQCPRN